MSNPELSASLPKPPSQRLGFNVDAAAIGIALGLAALIRLNVIHHIGW